MNTNSIVVYHYLFYILTNVFAFGRRVAHVNALTDRHASEVTLPPRVAGSVFKAQRMRNVM